MRLNQEPRERKRYKFSINRHRRRRSNFQVALAARARARARVITHLRYVVRTLSRKRGGILISLGSLECEACPSVLQRPENCRQLFPFSGKNCSPLCDPKISEIIDVRLPIS